MTGRFITGAALAAMALGGCRARREETVTHGWVRLAANPGSPAAAYFTIEGGDTPDTLVKVSAPFAAKAEMHETMAMGSHAMTTMAPLARVAVPAGKDVVFAPGGRHVMLFGLGPETRAPSASTMTMTFASGKKVEAIVNLVGPGDAPQPG